MTDRFPTSPIQSFVLIAADGQAITSHVNDLVRDLNVELRALAGGGGLGSDEVTIRQLRGWAAANGSPLYIYTIANDMAANHSDIADPLFIQWGHGMKMADGDALYVYLTGLLGVAPPIVTIKGYPA